MFCNWSTIEDIIIIIIITTIIIIHFVEIHMETRKKRHIEKSNLVPQNLTSNFSLKLLLHNKMEMNIKISN